MISSKTLPLSMDVLNLVVRIHEFKSAMRVMVNLTPPRLLALRQIATIESVGAGMRIGSVELSDKEVASVLAKLEMQLVKNALSSDKTEMDEGGIIESAIMPNVELHSDSLTELEVIELLNAAATPSHILNSDEQQAAGYYDGLNRVHSLTKEIILTEAHIKDLHLVLLGHSKKDSWHAGKYKVSANNLVLSGPDANSTSKVIQTASPADTPHRIAELLKWLQEEREAGLINPLLLIAIFTASFLQIRPFQDGNSRMSHLLTRLLLLKTGYHFIVYGSLESVLEKNRAGYYKAVGGIHTSLSNEKPDWEPWLVFFLDAVVEQVRRLNSKLEREKQIFSTLPKLSSAIVELAREHGRVTMSDAIKLTGSNRNTLKQHFRKLVFQGQLARHGMGAGVWYQTR
jgi:Fic family protein